MSIEKLSSDLEKIVEQIQDDDTTFDKCLELYNSGMLIAEKCLNELNTSKGAITQIKDKLSKIEERFDIEE